MFQTNALPKKSICSSEDRCGPRAWETYRPLRQENNGNDPVHLRYRFALANQVMLRLILVEPLGPRRICPLTKKDVGKEFLKRVVR